MNLNLLIVPTDSEFVPTAEDQGHALHLLETDDRVPVSDGVYINSYTTARLAGSIQANGGAVACPDCGATLDVRGEHAQWWLDLGCRLMNSDDPREETIEVPCCRSAVKASRLDLGGAARFARVLIEIVDPVDGEVLPPDLLDEVQAILKCHLLQLEQWDT